MESKKFKEPSFLAASAACILITLHLLLTLRSRTTSTTPPDSSAGELRQLKAQIAELQTHLVRLADEMKPMQAVASAETQAKEGQQAEFGEALSKAADHLKKGEFDEAHDFLLVASRISATDRRLFDAVTDFISKAKDCRDDEVVALAEDLLDRGDSLVHFQSPKDVESARKRLADLRASFPASPKKSEPEPRSEPIRRLIELAVNKDYPIEVRSKAAERARSALDEAWIDSALSSKDQGGDMKPDEIKQLHKQMEEAERRFLVELFDRHRATADAWLTTSRGLIEKNKDASPDELRDLSESIGKAITQGMDRLHEILPYAKSEVECAQKLSSDLEKQVKRLQRLKGWIYNQQALRLLREVEENKSWTAMVKIKILAGISEDLLSPYVSQRFGGIWDKVFDGLGDEDKVEATRLRILRASE